MSKVISKFKDFLGVGNGDEDLGEYDEEREIEAAYEEDEEEDDLNEPILGGRGVVGRSSNNVVSMNSSSKATGTKVLITKPTSYEESMEICDAVSNRRIVVINTANLENKTARRLLDFVSGASYALKGDFQEIDKGVYILSPANVEVTNELKSEITSKSLFGNYK